MAPRRFQPAGCRLTPRATYAPYSAEQSKQRKLGPDCESGKSRPVRRPALASQVNRCAFVAPVEDMIWYCDSCYPMVVEVSTNALKLGKKARGGIGQD